MAAKVSAQAESLMFNLFEDYDYDDIKENVFANSVVNAPVFRAKEQEESTPPAVLSQKAAKIEDFGQKIGGARKDLYRVYRDMLALAAKEEVEKAPFSKVWPKPDYEKLLKNGMEPWRVHAIRALRDVTVSMKPHHYRNFLIGEWAKDVVALREYAMQVLDGEFGSFGELQDRLGPKLSSDTYRSIATSYLFYHVLGHSEDCSNFRLEFAQFYQDSDPHDNPEDAKHENVYVLEQKLPKYRVRYLSYGDTMEEAVQQYAEKRKSLAPLKKERRLSDVYRVYRDNVNHDFFIGRKVGSNIIPVKRPFTSGNAAYEYKMSHLEELDAHFASMKNLPSERGAENKPRTGEAYRVGNVSPDDFMKAFGFRGVEFGNYVEDQRRQQDLNDAYDALMDLSKITGLPPRALSLGGELGLAFGARGHGGKNPALAHYEPFKTVINLTKKRGAGSLGHEWFHALDNMLAREYEVGEGQYASTGIASISRQELSASLMHLTTAIASKTGVVTRSLKLDTFRSKPYWGTRIEYMARSFEAYLKYKLEQAGVENDYLVNVLDEKAWSVLTKAPYAYPTKEETERIAPYFDELFANIQQRAEGENIVLYSASADIDAKALEKERIPFEKLQPKEYGLLAFGNMVLGVETAFYDGDPSLHGHFDPATSTMYLNRSSECGLAWVFSHETFHAMKEADPGLYQEILTLAGGVESFSKENMDAYRAERQKPDMPDELVRHEMLADAFADYTTGRRAIREMSEKQPTTVRRVLNFFSWAKDELQSRFFGEKQEETERKYPSARISREQFRDFAYGLEHLRDELRRSQNLTKGQEIFLAMLADAPEMETIHSPYMYAPEKQFAFDCKAVCSMSEMYPIRDVREVVASLSPCGSPGYEDRLMVSARGSGNHGITR